MKEKSVNKAKPRKRKNEKEPLQTRSQSSEPRVAFDMLVEHDKPPTGGVISDQPVTMELNQSNYVRDESGGAGSLWQLTGPVSSSTLHLADIKILHGSGEMLYKNLAASGCTMEVWLTEDTSGSPGIRIRDNVIITHPDAAAAGRQVGGIEIDVLDTAQFSGPGSSDPPASGVTRRQRYDHSDAALRITKIQITQHGGIVFAITAPQNPPVPEEYKIMIWTHAM
jgi:hypothetical protein